MTNPIINLVKLLIEKKKMKNFLDYLNLIEKNRKLGKLDEAWKLANEGVIKLRDRFESTMMYYQMSLIRRKEKDYIDSLSLFGIVVGLYGFGGASHKKHAEFLLRKVGKEGQIKKYLKLCKGQPKEIVEKIRKWANNSLK